MKTCAFRATGSLLFALLVLCSPLSAQTAAAQNNVALKKDLKQEYRRWLNCDIDRISSESETGPDFSIRLSYRKSPLSGYRVTVIGDGDQLVAADQTDSQGIARSVGIPPGRYEASVDGLGSPWTEIRVNASVQPERPVNLEWPPDVEVVRKLQGRLGISWNDVVSPFQSASLEVLDLRTGLPVATASTDSDGYYALPKVESGLYVLRVSFPVEGEMKAQTHDIAVEVNPVADGEEMPAIKFARSECAGILASEWEEPDRVLFDRAMKAINGKHFDVARLTLQTLINTYPESEYAQKAKVLLQAQEIGDCENVWSVPGCVDVRSLNLK